jgi:F0F1-type ATP synthase assembly protein I
VLAMPDTDSQRGNVDGSYARFVGLGFTFMFVIGFFIAAGYLVDWLLGTLPLFLLLGMVVGFVAAMVYLFSRLKNVNGR